MRLSGDQIEELIDLIDKTFTTDELRKLVAKCNRNLSDVDRFQRKLSGIFVTLTVSEAEGWFSSLLKEIVEARPDVERFTKFFSNIAPPIEISLPAIPSPTDVSSRPKFSSPTEAPAPIEVQLQATWSVDEIPINWSRQEPKDMENILVSIEPRNGVRWAQNCGVSWVDPHQDPRFFWRALLIGAASAGKLRRFLKEIEDDPDFKGIAGKLVPYLSSPKQIERKTNGRLRKEAPRPYIRNHSPLHGEWFGAQRQEVGPKGAPISYPVRLLFLATSEDNIKGTFRFTYGSDERRLDESIECEGEFISDRLIRVKYTDTAKLQFGCLILQLSDDNLQLSGHDVGYGYHSGKIATARALFRKQSILQDPFLDLLMKGAFPYGWATRAAFAHAKASEYWRIREIGVEKVAGTNEASISLFSRLEDSWDLLVSCGPGEALIDRELATALAGRVKRYVPVDISHKACLRAVELIAPACPVPLGIVGDLEDGFEFVRNALEQCNPGKLLMICTGNVIGNLDRGESSFFEHLSDFMRPDDTLLLSLAAGAFEGEPDRATFEQKYGWEDLRQLTACSMENITGEDWKKVNRELDDRLGIRSGTSDVPGATTREFFESKSGRSLLVLRRYDPVAFEKWVRPNFRFQTVGVTESKPISTGVGITTFLFKRV